eukprot:2063420-Pleurochrysis_carterae.AAC.1
MVSLLPSGTLSRRVASSTASLSRRTAHHSSVDIILHSFFIRTYRTLRSCTADSKQPSLKRRQFIRANSPLGGRAT